MKSLTTKSKKTYDIISKYRGVLMGLAILSVLIFHYCDDCKIASYNFNSYSKFYHTYICSSGVDIFLFLSGFGLYYSWKKNNSYKEFMSKRLKKILIPYFLIAIPGYIILNVLIKKIGFLSILPSITFYDFFTEGNRWYWYIFMIIICYSIYPWIFELVEENKTKIKSETSMMGIFTFVTIIAMMLQKYDSTLFKYINIMLLRFPVFIFGAFIGRASYEKRPIGKELLAFSIISLICTPLLNTKQLMLTRYVVGMLNLVICFLIIYLFDFLETHKIKLFIITKPLELFGKYSLELYLTHVTVRKIMYALKYPTHRIRYYLLILLISIILSLLVKQITNLILKLFNRKTTPA